MPRKRMNDKLLLYQLQISEVPASKESGAQTLTDVPASLQGLACEYLPGRSYTPETLA